MEVKHFRGLNKKVNSIEEEVRGQGEEREERGRKEVKEVRREGT